MITSSQNPKVKLARALLGRPKERRDSGAFLAEGVRLVEEAAAAGWPFQFVLFSKGLSARGHGVVNELRNGGIEVDEVSSSLMSSISETETSQGIMAVLQLVDLPGPDVPNFILIPDSIRDPGNLGTLLRSANAANVQAVLIPPETTDPYAPKVVRAGMGAHFRMPIHILTWETIQQVCQSANLNVLLADMNGQSCWETDFRKPIALIVGGEAQGASESALRVASSTVSIPMPGQSESLNAAAAGSILLFEVVRQRL